MPAPTPMAISTATRANQPGPATGTTAASRGYVSTPTVLVGGKKITSPTPAALTAAVTAAAG